MRNIRSIFATHVLIGALVLGVAPVWAAADLEEGVKDLADKIARGMAEKGTRKIAIIDFSDLNGRVTALGQFMAEELTTQLFLIAPGKFEVVERRQLLKLEQELALGQMGVIEEKSLKKMGQVLGVEAVVTGSMTDLGNTIKVNARMIAVESAKVFAVAATSIPKTGIVAELASRVVERPVVAGAPPAAPSFPATARAPEGGSPASKWMMENDKLIISVDELSIGNDRETLYLTYTNKTNEVLDVVLLMSGNSVGLYYKTLSSLDDSVGVHYDAHNLVVEEAIELRSSKEGTASLVKLPPNGRAPAAIAFSRPNSASGIKKGTTFSFRSEQAYVKDSETVRGARRGDKFIVTIRNIETR